MNYRFMFTINAVVLAVFGAVLMIMPEFILNQFGSEVYVATIYVTRFFGSALLLGGLLLWFLKETPAKTLKIIAFLFLAYSIGGFVLSLLGMTTVGVLRSNGWVLLVIFGLFSLVYGYMIYLQPKQPKQTETKSRSPRKVKAAPGATNNGSKGSTNSGQVG